MTEDKGARGCIFDIQRYSIHDGPGIRTTVFFKGCPLRCFWCQNPESQTITPQIFLYKDRCTLCRRCAEVCKNGAISFTDASSQIDRDRCIGCGKCVEVCPNDARKLAGRYMTAGEVLQEVLRDVKYYQNSGGGVTLSGGDPLFQPEFALEVLKRCKQAELHTAIETSGCAPWPVLERLLEYVDLVLYDIKRLDTGEHATGTGVPNELILENARMVARHRPMLVRVPLIPGFNDSPEEIEEIARFVKTELPSVNIELLAYNRMGESKYLRLDREPVCLESQDETYIQSLKDNISQILTKG